MKKFLTIFILILNLSIYLAPLVLAAEVPCKGKIAVETLESLGKEIPGKYEKGTVITECTNADDPNTCKLTKQKGGTCKPESSSTYSCREVWFVCGASGVDLLKNYVQIIYRWGVGICGSIAVLIIVVSGVQISAAGGDSGKIDEAKTRIMQSLSGLVILLLSALILYTINPTFFITT